MKNKTHYHLSPLAPMALIALLVAAGCTDVGVDRAAIDETVGQARQHGVEVQVEQGLAQVRALEPGRLVLWAGAPSFDAALTAERPGPLELEIRNIMPGATLEVDGQAVAEAAADREIPTIGRWSLMLDGPAELRLRAPEPPDGEPWRFVIFADVQDDIDRVQDLYGAMRERPEIRFGLISGDLTESGTPSSLERFQREMQTLPFPCYATLGNHELGTSEGLFHEYFGRGNSHFGHGGARFTLLDSASATIAPPVWGWLDGWLEAAGQEPHLVIMHIPPLDDGGTRNGGFASRAEANRLLGRLARGGVDLTVYGHVHTYRTYRNAGIPAFISGGGGAIPMRLDGIGRHFLTVEVDADRQDFQVGLVRVYPED